MKKNEFVLLLIIIFLALPLSAHDADIKIQGENRYKSLRLPAEVYNASHYRLFDLLIKDSNGQAVPYFINSSQQDTKTSRETWLLTLTDSFIKESYFFFDYKLAVERESDTIATSLEFSTRNTGFAKPVDVYGSHDGINWDFVQSDTLYVVEDKSKLVIHFRQPQKYTHYRFRLANNLEQISFGMVNLVYNTIVSEETWFIESLTPSFTVENGERETNIIIDGLKNLCLYDLTIDSDSMFIRNFRTPGGKKELYHLSINGAEYNDTNLPLIRHIARNQTFTVTIDDADDRPINIRGITVRYYAGDLVFEGKPGEIYTLEFGNDSVKTAPVYDIGRYSNEILKGPLDRLTLGPSRYTEAAAEAAEAAAERTIVFNKMFFNIVVILVTLLLAVLIIFRLKK